MTRRFVQLDRPDYPARANLVKPCSSAGSVSATFLLPLGPAGQSDLALLGGAGLAILLIVVLLVIVVILLIVIRRRSKQPKRKSRAPQPTRDVGSGAAQDDTPPLPLPTAPSVAPSVEEPTTPSVSVDKATVETTDITIPLVKQVAEPEIRPVSGQRPATIGWQIAGLTDVGLKRQRNEDKMMMIETATSENGPYGLYVVADGMGGHESGQVASQITINAIQTHFEQHSPGPTDAAIEQWLNAAVMAANKTVISRQKDKSQSKKMGSTLVMALVANGKAHIANVGDSRAYRLTQDTIQQISVDHSLVERLVEIGQITREEARTHKQRNVIYSTIGDKTKVQVGFYHVGMQPGDRLLLCSDGLTGVLKDEQILNISRTHVAVVEACRALVKAANAAGGDDNITVILVEMESEK